jgi:putative glycosyltransferase
MTIFCLGIIGIYLAKVFSEAKQRPRTLVREVYAREEETQEESADFADMRR